MKKLIAIAIGVALALTATVARAGRDSSGTMTFNSVSGGYPFQPGVISRTAMNAHFAELAAEITDSASRSGKGGFTAPVRAADGSSALPAFSFTNDTNSGFFRPAADRLGLALAGVEYADFSTTVMQLATNLGLSGASDQYIDKHSGRLIVSTTGNYDMVFQRNNTPYLSLNSGSIDVLSHRISSVADPVSSQDAATMAWVEAWNTTITSTTLTKAANWNDAENSVYKTSGRVVTFSLRFLASSPAPGSWSDIAALPVHYRPQTPMYFTGPCYLGGTTWSTCHAVVSVAGSISVESYVNASSSGTSVPAPVTSDILKLTGTFVASD